MKKLLLIIILAVGLTSCDNDNPLENVSPEQQKELTTVEIQQQATKDTICYKITLNKDNELLLINPKTNLVEKKVYNHSGVAFTFFLIMMFLFGVVIFHIVFSYY